MKLGLFVALVISTFSFDALAEEYRPQPLERAPEGEVECSWSKLTKEEYDECLQRKRFFNGMSTEEKQQYNAAVDKRILEQRIRRLERRAF